MQQYQYQQAFAFIRPIDSSPTEISSALLTKHLPTCLLSSSCYPLLGTPSNQPHDLLLASSHLDNSPMHSLMRFTRCGVPKGRPGCHPPDLVARFSYLGSLPIVEIRPLSHDDGPSMPHLALFCPVCARPIHGVAPFVWPLSTDELTI